MNATVPHAAAAAAADHESVLRQAALRVTRPRLAVLAALTEHPHSDTDAVIRVLHHQGVAVSHQAVYDVLRALTEAHVVRRIQPAGATARYELRTGDNHHHTVCRSCGAIGDVDCAVGPAPCLTAADTTGESGGDGSGFVVDEAEVVFWGTCPACATGPSPRTHPDPDPHPAPARSEGTR